MFFPRTSGKRQLKTGRLQQLSKCGLTPPPPGRGELVLPPILAKLWAEAVLAAEPRASVLTVAQRKDQRDAQWETETPAHLLIRGLLTQVGTTWELYKTQAPPWTA